MKLSNLEKEILQQISINAKNKKNISLTTFSEQNHVAASTVVKLAKKLGYFGYKEMIHSLGNESIVIKDNTVYLRLNEIFENITRDTLADLNLFKELLNQYKSSNNFVLVTQRHNYLAEMISRKLLYFGIVTFTSYEAGMFEKYSQNPGIITIIIRSTEQFEEYKVHFSYLIKLGYFIICLTDLDINYKQKNLSVIYFNTTTYGTCDFFESKVTCFVEQALEMLGEIK